MHGQVGGVGHQIAVGSEQGAGEIQTLLDVGGDGGLLQHAAHLLGDGHEQVAENGQLNRIHLRFQRVPPVFVDLDLDITEGADGRLTTRFDNNGGRFLDDDRRTARWRGPALRSVMRKMAVSHQPSSK